MSNHGEITQESFDRLLDWLGPDRERAGEKYEVIRRGLIQFFRRRGCAEVEKLADDTINRVIIKLPEIADEYSGEPARYFHKVAHYVFLEGTRHPKSDPFPSDLDLPNERDNSVEKERTDQCLSRCMGKISADDQRLIVEYYREDRRARIDHRRQLADRYGLSLNDLRVKAFRLRAALHRCLIECLEKISTLDVIDPRLHA